MHKMEIPTPTVAAGKRLELIYFMAEITQNEPKTLVKQSKNAKIIFSRRCEAGRMDIP